MHESGRQVIVFRFFFATNKPIRKPGYLQSVSSIIEGNRLLNFLDSHWLFWLLIQYKKMEELSSSGLLENKIAFEKGVVVYFYSDRCAPCISLRPKVKGLIEQQFPEMKLVFINSENHPEIPAQYGVFANPCILVFFEGKEFNRYSKYISIGQLSHDIGRIYPMVFGQE